MESVITTITVVGVICSIVFAFIGYQAGKKKDNTVEGENKGIIMSDIGYIKAGIDDLKQGHKETSKNVSDLSERVTRCEESCKQAHHRIEDLEREKHE